jgi:hypothetical protein
MKPFIVPLLALSGLAAGSLFAGLAVAQNTGVSLGTPVGTPGMLIGNQGNASAGTPVQSGNASAAGNVGAGIGPGTRSGVGAPIGGLDSNPYAEASPRVRAAFGGRVNQSASTAGQLHSGARVNGSSTLN